MKRRFYSFELKRIHAAVEIVLADYGIHKVFVLSVPGYDLDHGVRLWGVFLGSCKVQGWRKVIYSVGMSSQQGIRVHKASN